MKNSHISKIIFATCISLSSISALPSKGQWHSESLQYTEKSLTSHLNDSENFDKSTAINFSTVDTIRQSFIPESKDPKAKFALAQLIYLSTYYWTGSDGLIEYQIRKGDFSTGLPLGPILYMDTLKLLSPTDKSGIPIPGGAKYLTFSKSLHPDYLMNLSDETIDSLWLESGVKLAIGEAYTLEFVAQKLASDVRAFGFIGTENDYNKGESSDLAGKDIWFNLYGQIASSLDPSITIKASSNNSFFTDTASSHLNSKFIGLGSTEGILIEGNGAGNYTFATNEPSIIKLNSLGGVPHELTIEGLKEGQAEIYILLNNDTVGLVSTQVYPKRYITNSYSYIHFPGEIQHEFRTSFDSVTQLITNLYDSVNIEIKWINNGQYEYEWDLNGDSSSYDINYLETWTPIDSGVIKGADTVFSNLFVLRDNKDDSLFKGSNGGGSSRGFGQKDGPVRGAYKRITLNNNYYSIYSTLAHELGHNLGLSHYSEANTMYIPVRNDKQNMMKTGRDAEGIFAFQWEQIHRTIQSRKQLGEDYTPQEITAIQLEKHIPYPIKKWKLLSIKGHLIGQGEITSNYDSQKLISEIEKQNLRPGSYLLSLGSQTTQFIVK